MMRITACNGSSDIKIIFEIDTCMKMHDHTKCLDKNYPIDHRYNAMMYSFSCDYIPGFKPLGVCLLNLVKIFGFYPNINVFALLISPMFTAKPRFGE